MNKFTSFFKKKNKSLNNYKQVRIEDLYLGEVEALEICNKNKLYYNLKIYALPGGSFTIKTSAPDAAETKSDRILTYTVTEDVLNEIIAYKQAQDEIA